MNFSMEIHYDTPTLSVKIEDQAYNPSYTKPNCHSLNKFITKDKSSKSKASKEGLYNWSQTQNRRYINFLTKHGALLGMRVEDKKRLRVNVTMSKFIKTRTSVQCHTHHQKMMKKHGSIDQIIKQYSFLLNNARRGAKTAKIEEKQHIELLEQSIGVEELQPQFQLGDSIRKEYFNPQIIFHEQEQLCVDNLYFY